MWPKCIAQVVFFCVPSVKKQLLIYHCFGLDIAQGQYVYIPQCLVLFSMYGFTRIARKLWISGVNPGWIESSWNHHLWEH